MFRPLIGLVVAACLLFALPASAAAEGGALFTMDGTYSLVWHEGGLESEIHITALAVKESEPWDPCGTWVYPGAKMEKRENPWGTSYGWYDSSGHLVYPCQGPPAISPVLPQMLDVVFGSCKSKESPWPTLQEGHTTRPKSAGERTREEMKVDHTWFLPVDLDEPRPTSFCLMEFVTGSQPNKECAKYFAPELCAKEYSSGDIPIQEAPLRFVPTRTAACPSAKASLRRAKKEIGRLVAKVRRLPGRQPKLEGKIGSRRYYRETVLRENAIAQCQ